MRKFINVGNQNLEISNVHSYFDVSTQFRKIWFLYLTQKNISLQMIALHYLFIVWCLWFLLILYANWKFTAYKLQFTWNVQTLQGNVREPGYLMCAKPMYFRCDQHLKQSLKIWIDHKSLGVVHILHNTNKTHCEGQNHLWNTGR